MSGEEFAPANAREACERDAATRGRTMASFEGIDVIPTNYTNSAIQYVDSEGKRQSILTGPFGHYAEYWNYFRAGREARGPRRFAVGEREAFTDGAEVLVHQVGGEWWSQTVVGEIIADHGEECVQVRLPHRAPTRPWFKRCSTTGIRVPGARVGLDFQWETRGTERKASVFFCKDCGSTKGTFGRLTYNPTHEWYGVAWEGESIERGYDLADEHMFTPSVMDCPCRPTGGAQIDSREYWRRVIAVEAAGIDVWDVPAQRSYQHYECVVNPK